MKFSDGLADIFKAAGISNFFGVTGGAAVHLIDSLEMRGIRGTFSHHEQSSALAADAFARLKGLGLCVTTTGPGVTNALTGTLCSWQDSVSTVFVSGQSRTGNLAKGFRVRQAGTQHVDVEPLVSSLVKKFVQISPSSDGLHQVVELISLAKSGRPGPVWIDVPLDVQLSEVDESDLSSALGLLASQIRGDFQQTLSTEVANFVQDLETKLKLSRSPIFLFGAGMTKVPLGKVKELLRRIDIPFATTWGAAGASLETLKGWVGRIGVSGMRGANKAVMNSDFVISLGARFGQSTSGTNLTDFAPDAWIAACDVDAEELRYLEARRSVQVLLADAAELVEGLTRQIADYKSSDHTSWQASCAEFSKLNLDEYSSSQHSESTFDLYRFMLDLSDSLTSTPEKRFNISIDGGGTVVYASMQALMPSSNYKVTLASAAAPMGTGIPHAIGLGSAEDHPTIVLIGDGSLMFNLQEIQTAVTSGLDMVIFVLQNGGYSSIRSTQRQFLEGRYIGSEPSGGVEIPSIAKLARAFEVSYILLSPKNLTKQFELILSSVAGVTIVEVPISPDQEIYPRVAFEKDADSGIQRAMPLDKMWPIR